MKRCSGSNWLFTWILLFAVALIAACGTISPRRIVTNNPPGSPTPTITPTPSPGLTPTPSGTPTPTPMATAVPSQFLLAADPSTNSLIGFKINSDGGLSLIPGSPFPISDTPRQLSAAGLMLIVTGDKGLSAFAVDKETGAITRADSVSMQALSTLNQPRVFDASGRFLYVIDPARAEISAFEMRKGQAVPLSPAAYRAPSGATSLILVRP